MDTASHCRKRNLAILIGIVVVWLALDIASKAVIADVPVGEVVAGPYLGIFQITCVHNTGAAWGILGDSTFALGIFAIIVCAIALVYLFVLAPRSSVLSAIGISLIVAGGIGNAIDRFANGYVLDMIMFMPIDFPVFNVADIGVTCGVVILIIALVIESRGEKDGE